MRGVTCSCFVVGSWNVIGTNPLSPPLAPPPRRYRPRRPRWRCWARAPMAQPAAPGPVPMVNSSAVVDDPAGLRAALDQDGYLFLPGLVPRSAVLAGMRRFADVIGEAVRPGAREGDLLVNPAAEPGKDNGIIRPEKADALMADPTIRAVSTTDYYPPTYTHTQMQHTHNKKRATGQAQQRECEMAMVHREMSGRLVQVIGSEEIVGLFERLFGGQSAAFDHKWFRFVLPGRAASWLSHTRGRTGVHQGQADRVSRQDQKKQAAQQAEGQGSTSRQHTQVGGETVRGRHQPHTGAGPRSSSRSSPRHIPTMLYAVECEAAHHYSAAEATGFHMDSVFFGRSEPGGDLDARLHTLVT